ncbi:MAG: RHS repeat-associated core domain-containing protein [Pirellulaceae bacterium]
MAKTYYFWDPIEDNVIEEYDENGDTIVRYETEPELHGNLISQERDGVASYYHYDGQGSTLALTDEAGEVTDEYSYSAFGETTKQIGTTENSRRYVGEKGYECDSEVGVYYVRARQYEPRNARWLSRDPLGIIDGINLYTYCKNDPSVFSDPQGTSVWLMGTAAENAILLAEFNLLCPAGAFVVDARGELTSSNTTCNSKTEVTATYSLGPWGCYEIIETIRDCEDTPTPISCCCICEAIGQFWIYEIRNGGFRPMTQWGIVGTTVYAGSVPDGATGHGDPGFETPGKVRSPDYIVLGHELCGHAVSGLGMVQGTVDPELFISIARNEETQGVFPVFHWV